MNYLHPVLGMLHKSTKKFLCIYCSGYVLGRTIIFLISINSMLQNFEFIISPREAIQVSIVNDRFSFNNLNINVDPSYFDTPIYKVLSQSIFNVDVIGISDDKNLPHTCTLFLTEDYRARISIIGNRAFSKLILSAINGNNQCFRLNIFDATSLEAYCLKVLRESSGRNFVATIDSFKFEERLL